MIKSILFFIVVATISALLVELFLSLSLLHKKKVLKWLAFSFACGIMSLLFIFMIVFIF